MYAHMKCITIPDTAIRCLQSLFFCRFCAWWTVMCKIMRVAGPGCTEARLGESALYLSLFQRTKKMHDTHSCVHRYDG